MTDFRISNKPALDADTIIKVVLDRSGSMNSIRHDTLGGLNVYLDELKKKNPGRTLFSLTQFDSGGWGEKHGTQLIETYSNTPLEEVQNLTESQYVPSGGTPLYDAIGQIITRTRDELAGCDPKPNVLLVIITDGENTDNHGYQQPQVKEMITDLEKNHGWTVAYLGANQDAWSVGSSLGLSRGNTMNYTTNNMAGTMRAMGAVSSTYLAASSASKMADPFAVYATMDSFADAGVKEEDLTK